MIRKYAMAFMALVMFGLSGALHAEELFAHAVRATIPFEFAVGKQAMPAGDYTVSIDQQSGRILLTGPSSYSEMTIPKETRELPTSGKLVFQQDGSKFFLTEVWTPENSTGQVLVHESGKQVKHTLQIDAR